MTKITILPIPAGNGTISYHAVAGDKRSEGTTAGKALDALTPQLSGEESGTLVIVLEPRRDRFFDADSVSGTADVSA